MRRRPLLLLAALALVAVVVVGLLQSSGTSDSQADVPSPEEVRELLAGAPAPLARLHARGNRLLPADSVEEELAALKGHPVVVNKWGSWCTPCRQEFPTFQRVSAELGKEVAFLGLDVQDARDEASAFLRENPLSYPSIYDPKLTAANALSVASSYNPATIFYDATGKQTYVHQGPYLDPADLRADIAKYTGS